MAEQSASRKDFNSQIEFFELELQKTDDPSPEHIQSMAAETGLSFIDVFTWFWKTRSTKRKAFAENATSLTSISSSYQHVPGLTSSSTAAGVTIVPTQLTDPPPVPESFPYINSAEDFLDLHFFPDLGGLSNATDIPAIPKESQAAIALSCHNQNGSQVEPEKYAIGNAAV